MVLQLEHPEPLPLKVYILPFTSPERKTICPDGDIQDLPSIRIIDLNLEIEFNCTVRTRETIWDSTNNTGSTFEFPLGSAFEAVEIPVSVNEPQLVALQPQNSDTEGRKFLGPFVVPKYARLAAAKGVVVPGSVNLALNLGRHFSILLDSSASRTRGSRPIPFHKRLYPSLTTYDITLDYRLDFKLNMDCAGDVFIVEGCGTLTILGPSEAQEHEKERYLGTEGMKRNHVELFDGLEHVIEMIGQIIEAVSQLFSTTVATCVLSIQPQSPLSVGIIAIRCLFAPSRNANYSVLSAI